MTENKGLGEILNLRRIK